VTPPSYCPRCKKSIAWYDNIPLISFFVLGGKCRYCLKPISWQYPIVESMTAFLFFFSSFSFQKGSKSLVFASFFFVSFLLLLAFSDFLWRLLPHLFNNLFIIAGLFFNVLLNFHSPSAVFTAVCDSIIIGSVVFGMFLIVPNGLGGGDIKMVVGLAIWMGFLKAAGVLIFACFLALLFFFILFSSKKIQWKWMIPFGPFLAIGALVFWFFPSLADSFLRIISAKG